jgi:hypothetical protein
MLYRLGVDDPEYLPRPPVTSEYYEKWVRRGGPIRSHEPNIYREKFDAYYGKHLAVAVERGEPAVTTETVFPVVVTTAVLTVAWTAVFWSHLLTATPTEANSLNRMLMFGFLGAYVFIVQMLMRRYFQNDLRALAYSHALIRLVTVFAIIPVLHQLPAFSSNNQWEPAVAFVIGVFPLVAVQAMLQIAAKTLRTAVPSLHSEYPLNQLDGLNVWYEAQLLEEGVEDMQNLATANLIDVILHTRVPVGRLIDWVDQSYLYLRLPPKAPGRTQQKAQEDATHLHIRDALRTAGFKDATSLERIAPSDSDDPRDVERREAVLKFISGISYPPTCTEALETAAVLLRDDPGLDLVRHWHTHGARAQRNGVAARAMISLEEPAVKLPDEAAASGNGSSGETKVQA